MLAVLNRDPVGKALRCRTLDLDHEIRHMMDRARSRRRSAESPHQRLDLRPSDALAERRVPGAVLGEQRRHFGEAVVVEAEAIFRHHLADRILLGEFGHAMVPPAMSYVAIA